MRDIWAPSGDRPHLVEFRPLVPLDIAGQLNILRLSVPFRTSSGLGDVRLFDLLGFPLKHGLWGIGPAVNLRTSPLRGGDSIQGGFACGLVWFEGRWSFGLLNQNVFSGQVAVSTFQPVLVYKLDEQWTLGLGELPFIVDLKSLSRTYVPIGFQVGFRAGTVRVFVNPQYNVRQLATSAHWTLTSGVTLEVDPFLR